MKRYKTLWGGVLLSLVLAACTTDEQESYYGIEYNEDCFNVKNVSYNTYVRFEDQNGNNMLEAFSDIPRTSEYVSLDNNLPSYLKVRCIRESDKAEMTWSQVAWFNPQEDYPRDSIFGTGPMLYLNWLDMDVYSGRNHNKTYNETYTITLQNTRVWGEEVTHTIRWFIHVEHDQYSATRCTLDGKDITPWGGKEYYYMFGYNPEDYESHLVNGVIHVKK